MSTTASASSPRRDADARGAQQGLRLLIVDDRRVFAEALAAGLSSDPRFASVRVAYSEDGAHQMLSTHNYDVLLLDVNLGAGSGLALLDHVAIERPRVAVVIVADLDDVEEVIYALAHGARAWVTKGTPLNALLTAIDEAVAGHVWLPTALLGPVLHTLIGNQAPSRTPPSFVDDLTPRQLEVLICLAEGKSRSQIARDLVLSPNTVRTHVQDILRKADAHSTLAALAIARRAGHLPRKPPD